MLQITGTASGGGVGIAVADRTHQRGDPAAKRPAQKTG
jgi:hypothetical protein